MTRHAMARVVTVAAAILTASLVSGCSSSDTPLTSSGSSGTSGDGGTSPSGLSLAFASRCARCHGTTATGQDIYPALPGSLTLADFTATVRAGRKLMPSFTASQITDADIASDYQWMTTKR